MRLGPPLLIALPAALAGCAIPGPDVPREREAEIRSFVYSARLPIEEGLERSQIAAFRSAANGDEPLVVYVHGTPGDASNFASFLVDPVEGTQSVSIDRPGFGMSRPRRAVSSLAAQAAAIAPLLEARDGVKPILVGHSYGGPVIAQVAADYPGLVGGVVLLAASLDPGLERILLIQRVGALPIVDMLLPRWLRNTNRELMPLEGELELLEPRLAEIGVPITIIHGTEDSLVPYANVDFMVEHFGPRARVVTLDGGNHFIPWNSEDVIRREIAAMAAGLATPAVEIAD
ncbi:MAG: alpha/beta hydrolase [Planctomycetota bacterium]